LSLAYKSYNAQAHSCQVPGGFFRSWQCHYILRASIRVTRLVAQRKPDSLRESGNRPLSGSYETASHFFLAAGFFLAVAFFAHLPQLTCPTSLLEESI